jgi:hypothetical protein
VVFPEAAVSELDQDVEDLSVEMDDELPDLEEMMDFDDDDLSLDSSDEDAILGVEADAESLVEMDESELGPIEADDDLPDLDMDLDDLDEAVEADSSAAKSEVDSSDDALALSVEEGGDELDLSDLEDLVGADDEVDLRDDTPEVAPEADLDSGMDIDLEPDELAPAATEAPAAEDAGEDLDMTDFDDLVEADTDTPIEEVASESAEDADLDLDLEAEAVEDADLDLDLEAEAAQDAELDLGLEAEAAADTGDLDVETEDGDELDLSDIEDIMESAEESADESQNVEALDNLNLDLDLDAEPTEAAPVTSAEEDLDAADELDFSDLEGIIESDEPAEAEAADDLELEFEVGDGEEGAVAAEPAKTSDEMDMADLEQMLDSDDKPASEGADELELDLDLDLEQETAGETEPAASDDAEFLDIEQMLEADGDAAAGTGADEVAELDLEAVMDEATQSAEQQLELNLDLDDDVQEPDTQLEDAAAGEEDLDFNLMDSDEETLQFGATQAAATQLQEDLSDSTEAGATSEDFATEEFVESGDMYEPTDTLNDMDAAAMGVPVKKRSMRKPLMAVVLILLLCVVGIIVTNNLGIKIPYVSDVHIPYVSDIKIPYLSGLMTPKVEDTAGNLKITPMSRTITYKFVDNNTAGQILVISGQVRNEYDHPRSNIKVTGKIYHKGKKLADTATVYAGNTLSDADLQRMEITAISKRLQNRFGDNRSNVKVKTGKTIPFLIVFNQLPPNLDEYTVQVAGSSS